MPPSARAPPVLTESGRTTLVPCELSPVTPLIAEETAAGTTTSRAGACRSLPETRYWWMPVPNALVSAELVPLTVIACWVTPTTVSPASVAHFRTAAICASVAPKRASNASGARNSP